MTARTIAEAALSWTRWDLKDPKGLPIEEVREIRDDIARRIATLIEELDDPAPEAA